MHAQHITNQQLKETRTNTPYDTIFWTSVPGKTQCGKSVQLSEGFLIKQYQSTIWVPKLAYPTKNFLSSNTSRFLTNLLAETPDNPSSSYSAPICARNPQSGLHQPLLAHCWHCVSLSWSASVPGDPASALSASASTTLAPLVLYAALSCLCMALHEHWLLLHLSLSGFSAAIPTLSLPLCLSVLNVPQLLS